MGIGTSSSSPGAHQRPARGLPTRLIVTRSELEEVSPRRRQGLRLSPLQPAETDACHLLGQTGAWCRRARARTARVTWRCQPANERPSKWSRPRPVFQLAVVVLDPPPDLGQADELCNRGVLGQGGQPVAGGPHRPRGGHSASSQRAGKDRSAARVMWRLAGRTRMARKEPVMAACGVVPGGLGALPPGHRPDLGPRRAIASWRTVAGGPG